MWTGPEFYAFIKEKLSFLSTTLDATPFVPERWPVQKGCLTSDMQIALLSLDLHHKMPLKFLASCQDQVSKWDNSVSKSAKGFSNITFTMSEWS